MKRKVKTRVKRKMKRTVKRKVKRKSKRKVKREVERTGKRQVKRQVKRNVKRKKKRIVQRQVKKEETLASLQHHFCLIALTSTLESGMNPPHPPNSYRQRRPYRYRKSVFL